MKIPHTNGSILYSGEAETFRDLVMAAVADDADLRGANLRGAYLSGAKIFSGWELTQCPAQANKETP